MAPEQNRQADHPFKAVNLKHLFILWLFLNQPWVKQIIRAKADIEDPDYTSVILTGTRWTTLM